MDVMRPNSFAVGVNPQNRSVDAVASFVNRHLERSADPARRVVGSPPNYGEEVIPHVLTFHSLVGTFSRAYQQSDEALQDSWENARIMRNDVGIMECVEARQRMAALLSWSIEPEDEKHFGQVSLATELEKILRRIRRFTEYRRNLMEAIWFGRYGIQNTYGWQSINGRLRLMPCSKNPDHHGWKPVHGDKIVFRYDDGNLNASAGEYADQMGLRRSIWSAWHRARLNPGMQPEPTGESMVQFLRPHERAVFSVHKHMIEDADYQDPRFAGSIHGVGIRSRIYWENTLKMETLAFLMEYLERSAGGIEVWTYPLGDEQALTKLKEAAAQRQANGRNQLFFPKPLGDDTSAYNLEIVEPGFAGAEILQTLISEYFGHRIKRYILGQTLSSEAQATGLGSGVADAHLDTLYQIVQYDVANLEDTMTSEVVQRIQLMNWPETAGWHMQFKIETQDDDASEKLNSFRTAWEMGAKIPAKDVLSACGVGKASDGEEVLSNDPPMQMDPMAMGVEQDMDGDGIAGENYQLDRYSKAFAERRRSAYRHAQRQYNRTGNPVFKRRMQTLLQQQW